VQPGVGSEADDASAVVIEKDGEALWTRVGREPSGILAIIPGCCSLCVWSQGLDDKGNSIAEIAALDVFTTLTGWSVF
jgi:glutaminase